MASFAQLDSMTAALDAIVADFSLLTTMKKDDAFDSAIEDALDTIKAERLDYIRCALTGARVAKIEESEIRIYLTAQMNNKPMNADALVDQWNLSLFAMSTRPGPAMQNNKDTTLETMVRYCSDWAPRLIAHYLARFVFGFKVERAVKTINFAMERLHFVCDWYDFLIESDQKEIATIAYKLSAADAWLNLADWHSLALMGRNGTVHGIRAEKHQTLRGFTLAHDALEMSIAGLQTVVNSMVSILAATEATNTSVVSATNRASIAVLQALQNDAAAYQADPTGLFPAPESKPEVDPIALAQAEVEYEKRRAAELAGKTVWSATHGKGYLPGASGPVKKPKAEKVKKLSTRQAKIKAEVDAALAAMAKMKF